MPHPRVLIVCEHTSLKMGGEAARPLHYFRVMRRRGVEAWMLVHERTQGELKELLPPDEFARIHFVPDSFWQRLFWRMGKPLPDALRLITFDALTHFVTQIAQRKMTKTLVKELNVQIVHEPIPISPKQFSMTWDVGAPVVIGPLNGGMTYPPAFYHMEGTLTKFTLWATRFAANVLNRIYPGKLLADTVLVSNPRTREALPKGVRGKVVELVANAVDMSTWNPSPRFEQMGQTGQPCRFAFLGRLVDFKMTDLLLEAFAPVARAHNAVLDIIGDGPERPKLEALVDQLGLRSNVLFAGWMSPKQSAQRLGEADVLVFPSLRECGGAVVMEAMAVGLAVIAADWGGPADYVGDDGSGVLVKPTSRDSFVTDFTRQMDRLAADPALRRQMSRAARLRAQTTFDWEARVDRLLDVYSDTLARAGR